MRHDVTIIDSHFLAASVTEPYWNRVMAEDSIRPQQYRKVEILSGPGTILIAAKALVKHLIQSTNLLPWETYRTNVST
jgi:hypothetical protein